MNVWMLIAIAWAAMIVVMVVLWLVQRRTHNAGIVDIGWSFGAAVCAGWFAWGADGDIARRVLVASIAGLWGLKLGVYLTQRIMDGKEDARYAAMRERWGDKTQRYMFVIFQVQAFWAVLFALPMLLAASNPAEGLRWYDWLGVALWAISMGGTFISDQQLQAFRTNPENKGLVCRRGLWKYSRHPNYFFEWFHWWAYVAIGLAGPLGWLTLLGPAVMLFFLLKVTGIPITERRLVESRGERYRRYQRTTSAFVPWPPKPGAEHINDPVEDDRTSSAGDDADASHNADTRGDAS